MVKHIVLWTLQDGLDKDKAFRDVKELFDGFAGEVAGLRSLNLYRGFAGHDICLISEHDDKEALEVYQQFPAHTVAKEFIKGIRQSRASCDFEV